MTTTGTMTVEKAYDVPLSPADAFELFTRRCAEWWPLETHACHPGEVAEVVWEEHAGGRIYERTADGREGEWGIVEVWDAPHRIVYRWHPDWPAGSDSRVDLRFEARGEGTRVSLTHTGFESRGDDAERVHEGYDLGWDLVLGERFAAAAAG